MLFLRSVPVYPTISQTPVLQLEGSIGSAFKTDNGPWFKKRPGSTDFVWLDRTCVCLPQGNVSQMFILLFTSG